MQNPPHSDRSAPRAIRPGDLVRARRARWRVVRVHAFGACQIVTVSGVAAPLLGVERRLLLPFDTIEGLSGPPQPRMVRAATWRRACRALIAGDAPPGSLRAALTARIDLLPHQLEPALAVLRGAGTRLLLADEVGLGKTIEAGLIVAELRARGWVDRVLVLTPPGLRNQWIEELTERFAIDAAAVDAGTLRRLAASLPIGVNPWRMVSTAVVSIDYLKRPEVLPAAAECRWDLVIADEAHAAAGDSDRRAAIHALAARAAYVLLLSATPHNGDRESFDALCRIGSVDSGSPLLVFRRTRADVGIGRTRRIHIARIRPSVEEARMHALLARYTTAVRAEQRGTDAWLALSVLHKRALSSAWSLAQSIDRRLAALDEADRAAAEQMALPLGDPHGELIEDDQTPSWPADLRLSDPARERRMLAGLLTSAQSAAARETKLNALARLLRRAQEPAVVFTEYRDTLLHVRDRITETALVLHGGLGRDERLAVLDAFARGPRRVLIATDAAAEGLNLHHRCRLVINLELPWNPMRLEQRIGRVDRIGQRRTVHAFHLIAHGTGEARLLARLRARVAVARADIGAPDPLGGEREIARIVMKQDGRRGPRAAR